MKAVLALISSLALAAGLFFGYLDHQRPADRPASTPKPEATAVPGKPAEVAKPAPTPAPSPPSVPKVEAPGLPLPDPDELAATLREIESSILKEEFQAARAISENLVERYRGNSEALRLLEKVRRLEEKANGYSALLAGLETKELPEDLHRVSLVNGNSLVALSVKEKGDRYEIEYVLGGKGSLTRDRVSGVAPLPRAEYLKERWKEIREKVERTRDPFDLFFFGVRKCFRDGLRREGISLVDRLLAMPDSGQVVALYAKDKDGAAVRSWEQAAGRQELEPLARAETVEVAAAADQGGGEDEGDGVDPAGLARARTIIEGVESSLKRPGGDAERFDARTRILSAVKVLYGLPPRDDRVRELNRRAADLLNRVMKDR
jgi:hypothetical protein